MQRFDNLIELLFAAQLAKLAGNLAGQCEAPFMLHARVAGRCGELVEPCPIEPPVSRHAAKIERLAMPPLPPSAGSRQTNWSEESSPLSCRQPQSRQKNLHWLAAGRPVATNLRASAAKPVEPAFPRGACRADRSTARRRQAG